MPKRKTGQKPRWQKTNVQGLLRHTKSGGYYARLHIAGKEKWKSLKTTSFEVAKGKMRTDDTVTDIRQAQETKQELRTGSVTVGTLIDLHRVELGVGVKNKESTKGFWMTVLNSIALSWPELKDRDARTVTLEECKQWQSKFAKGNSPTYTNNAVLALRRVFDIAVSKGAIFRNPAQKLPRVRVKPTALTLPTCEQFRKIVAAMRKAVHRTAQDAADLVELLAYTGCRIGEARRITWADIDFQKGQIVVKGDPVTGTKNWGYRTIPLLPDCRKLLLAIQKRRGTEVPSTAVSSVGEARVALSNATKAEGAPTITHHDLRHFFATIAIQSGVDIPTVSRWLGHKDGGALAMKVYAHSSDEHSQAAAKKVSFGN
jgi:integrase